MIGKRSVFAVILLSVFIASVIPSFACTIFVTKDGDKVLAGNNEDFFYTYDSTMRMTAGDGETYGRVCFANSSFVQGGMNEKGLFYDGAMCPDSEVPFDESKPVLGTDMGEVILSKCATVKEAVELLKNNNIPKGFGDHLLIADVAGDSVVIEWLHNEMKVISMEGKYQIATNFFISDPDLGGYPCSRYETARSMLDSGGHASIQGLAEILDAVSQDWGDGGTKYSDICDLGSLNFYVFKMGDFSKTAAFNLTGELNNLKSGEKKTYKIDELQFTDSFDEPLIAAAPPAAETSQNAENTAGPNNNAKNDLSVALPSTGNYNNQFFIIPASIAACLVIFLGFRLIKRKQSKTNK